VAAEGVVDDQGAQRVDDRGGHQEPAYADVNAKQVWAAAEANITQKGWTAEKAADDALEQIKTIFEEYTIT
jgi:hypothetical protein